MSAPNKPSSTASAEEPALRPHTYDGISEYDARLPNWWLFTLYGAVAFSIVYWMFYHTTGMGLKDEQVLAQKMEAVAEARLASSMGSLTDAQLWEMSRDPKFVTAGKTVFATNCVACHLASLKGKEENPAAVGPSLVDNVWIHGAKPTDLRRTVTNGVIEKGMPTWAPLLGDRKVVEVVAYVLSFHKEPASP
ncbi:MAG: c-type cytochrome [Opitutaceae bacterium]|nr:c-type cytochrome [Opitutaceae bacterium]